VRLLGDNCNIGVTAQQIYCKLLCSFYLYLYHKPLQMASITTITESLITGFYSRPSICWYAGICHRQRAL